MDFSGAFRLPLNQSGPNQGEIPPIGEAVLGFTLNANEGDVFDLSFTRLSGNLNLGLVVISTDNEIVFQASLITTQTLRTLFTLPSTGEYTIGVFRIDLLPPATPEATAFQIQAKLNP